MGGRDQALGREARLSACTHKSDTVRTPLTNVRIAPHSGAKADMPGGPSRAHEQTYRYELLGSLKSVEPGRIVDEDFFTDCCVGHPGP